MGVDRVITERKRDMAEKNDKKRMILIWDSGGIEMYDVSELPDEKKRMLRESAGTYFGAEDEPSAELEKSGLIWNPSSGEPGSLFECPRLDSNKSHRADEVVLLGFAL